MGVLKGQLVICDRCKLVDVFLKHIGEAGLSNYAGPGVIEKFEGLPSTWIYDTHFGYLCPKCAKEFNHLLREFFGDEKYENLAPAWKIELEEK